METRTAEGERARAFQKSNSDRAGTKERNEHTRSWSVCDEGGWRGWIPLHTGRTEPARGTKTVFTIQLNHRFA
jgi:hypothetical protein